MKQESKQARTPKPLEAISVLVILIAVIVVCIQLKIGAQMALMVGTLIAAVAALTFHNSWADIQQSMLQTITDSLMAILILILVGIMIGAWMIGGTVPSIMYYGLMFCTPSLILPLSFSTLCSNGCIYRNKFWLYCYNGISINGCCIWYGYASTTCCRSSYFRLLFWR